MPLSFLAHRRQMCRIRHLNNFIEEHLDDALTLERLAEVAALSPAHLVRFYTAQMGEAPMQVLRRLRLQRAFGDIAGGRCGRLTDVGFQAGYGSSAAFSHAFRKEFGIAPRDVPSLLAQPVVDPPLRREYLPERRVYALPYSGVYAQNGYYKARLMWLCHAAGRDDLLSWRRNDRDTPFTEHAGQRVDISHFVTADVRLDLPEADQLTLPGGWFAVVTIRPDERERLMPWLAERIREELGCVMIEGQSFDRDIHERARRTPQERRVEIFIPVFPLAQSNKSTKSRGPDSNEFTAARPIRA